MTILNIIDTIDEIQYESTQNVMKSLLHAYEKSYTILDWYDGNEFESFQIFQEAFGDKKEEYRQTDKNGKKEHILKSIIKLIPRLINNIIHFIKKKMGKIKDTKIDTNKMSILNDRNNRNKLKEFIESKGGKAVVATGIIGTIVGGSILLKPDKNATTSTSAKKTTENEKKTIESKSAPEKNKLPIPPLPQSLCIDDITKELHQRLENITMPDYDFTWQIPADTENDDVSNDVVVIAEHFDFLKFTECVRHLDSLVDKYKWMCNMAYKDFVNQKKDINTLKDIINTLIDNEAPLLINYTSNTENRYSINEYEKTFTDADIFITKMDSVLDTKKSIEIDDVSDNQKLYEIYRGFIMYFLSYFLASYVVIYEDAISCELSAQISLTTDDIPEAAQTETKNGKPTSVNDGKTDNKDAKSETKSTEKENEKTFQTKISKLIMRYSEAKQMAMQNPIKCGTQEDLDKIKNTFMECAEIYFDYCEKTSVNVNIRRKSFNKNKYRFKFDNVETKSVKNDIFEAVKYCCPILSIDAYLDGHDETMLNTLKAFNEKLKSINIYTHCPEYGSLITDSEREGCEEIKIETSSKPENKFRGIDKIGIVFRMNKDKNVSIRSSYVRTL